MKCWHCNASLIWGGDHDIDDDNYMSEEYLMETNLSCPDCGSFVLVYYPKQEEDLYSS